MGKSGAGEVERADSITGWSAAFKKKGGGLENKEEV